MTIKSTDSTRFQYGYFKNLDTLRWLAFLGVFLSHTILFKVDNKIVDHIIVASTFDYLSVPFFFSLSSFLITFNLLSEKKRNGDIQLFQFYKNRALRIWPLYFGLVIIGFFLIPGICNLLHISPPTLPTLLPFLFFYVNYHIIEHGLYFTFILLILWSISIEEQFYIFWGSVLKTIPLKAVLVTILSLFSISIIYSYYNLSNHFLVIDTIFVLQNFCMGAIVAWLAVCNSKLMAQVQKMPSSIFLIPYIILPIAYIAIDNDLAENIIKSFCYAGILYDQTLNEKRIFNFGKFAFGSYLGKISYGLYIYHALVIEILSKTFDFFNAKNMNPTTNIFQILIALTITIIMAHFSYQYVEKRFLALKTHRS